MEEDDARRTRRGVETVLRPARTDAARARLDRNQCGDGIVRGMIVRGIYLIRIQAVSAEPNKRRAAEHAERRRVLLRPGNSPTGVHHQSVFPRRCSAPSASLRSSGRFSAAWFRLIPLTIIPLTRSAFPARQQARLNTRILSQTCPRPNRRENKPGRRCAPDKRNKVVVRTEGVAKGSWFTPKMDRDGVTALRLGEAAHRNHLPTQPDQQRRGSRPTVPAAATWPFAFL